MSLLDLNFYIVDDDFYATLLQLGLDPVSPKTIARKTQTETKTHEKSTQTEKPTTVFWGYF